MASVELTAFAMNAIRREYANLPRDKHGYRIRGAVRDLLTKYGISRAYLQRLCEPDRQEPKQGTTIHRCA